MYCLRLSPLAGFCADDPHIRLYDERHEAVIGKNGGRFYPSAVVSGGDLLSRAVASQVPSALRGLTSVFGMGTGGTLLPLSPEFLRFRAFKTAQ